MNKQCLLSFILLFACQTAATAQAARNPYKRPPQPLSNMSPKPSLAAQQANSYFEKLQKPISLPGVPDLGSSGVFRFGLKRQEKGTVSVGLRYGTSSSPQQTLDFFKQSLLAEKWSLKSASNASLQASRGDAALSIKIMPKGSPEVQTDFMINYTGKDY
ncbi:MAG: hypothetical protein K2X27_28415 [Candidatus Obscuribacterales bacterium]|nr:hypothetical protein [Candidatus Obscuribacterales bacterium]